MSRVPAAAVRNIRNVTARLFRGILSKIYELALGKVTSSVEVTDISIHGIWIFINNKEYFLSFENSPWFRERFVASIFNVVELSPYHFYRPNIDVDLTKGMIENPKRYLLLSKQ